MRKLRQFRLSNFPKKQQQWTRGSPQRKMGDKEVAEGAEPRQRSTRFPRSLAYTTPQASSPRCTVISPFVSFCPPWNSVCYKLVFFFLKCFNSRSESFRDNDLTLNLDKQKRDPVVELKLRQSLFGDFPLLRAPDSGFENRVWFQKLISPRQI